MRKAILTLGLAAMMAGGSLAIADNIIYANNAGGSGIQVYDETTGALLNTILPSNVTNGRGVVVVGNTMYYTEADSNSVYGYDLTTNTSLGAMFSVAGASGLATMAYDGTNLYLGDYSGTNHVYKYSLGGTLLQTISLSNCGGYCDGLEYADGHLISNRMDGGYGNPSTYDVYDLNGNLLQANFITTTFGATGIAFDGTNYVVSDIYHGQLDFYNASGQFVRTLSLQNPTYLIEDLSANYAQTLSPEPGSVGLVLAGLGGLALAGRRRMRAGR